MKQINFCKLHGFGNDYIVFEAADLAEIGNINDFAAAICRRNTGIGGDGIAVLRQMETTADFECRIINPDGSEAGFSGNGTRCAVAYLYYKNLWSGENLKLQTNSGIKNYQFLKRDANTFWFLAELGKPRFGFPETALSKAIHPETGKELEPAKTANFLLPGEGLIVNFVYIDVGNPVAVVFVADFAQLEWRRVGRIMESSTEIFPERANIVFVKIIDRENIEIRIWERGAGETYSSGTCSIAAAVASAFTEKTSRKVAVHAEGGTTEAVWRDDGEMMITGRADLVFCGEVFI